MHNDVKVSKQYQSLESINEDTVKAEKVRSLYICEKIQIGVFLHLQVFLTLTELELAQTVDGTGEEREDMPFVDVDGVSASILPVMREAGRDSMPESGNTLCPLGSRYKMTICLIT